jgi:hypothetical protein
MKERQFQSRVAQGLWELFKEYDAQLTGGDGMWVVLYKAVRGSIPDLLESLDQDPQTQKSVVRFLRRLAFITGDELVKAPVVTEIVSASDSEKHTGVPPGNRCDGVEDNKEIQAAIDALPATETDADDDEFADLIREETA